jgi:hypothetical protein
MMDIYNFPAHIEKLGISIDDMTARQKVEILEYGLLKNFTDISKELPLAHHICNGVYARELFIPAGTLLTGKIHKTKHISIIQQGDISVMTEEGMKRIQGPAVIQSESGMKRAGYAHTDTIWITIHPTHLTDISEIEDSLFYDSDLSWIDYHLTIKKHGFNHEDVVKISENTSDQIIFNMDYGVEVKDSPIQGKGLFATKDFKEGVICPARLTDMRTPAGRYTNHAMHPNCKMITHDGDVYLKAIKPIKQGDELTIDYGSTILCQQ